MRHHYYLPALILLTLSACSPESSPVAADFDRLPNTDAVVETTLPGTYVWTGAVPPPDDQRGVPPVTPATEGYKQSLIVTEAVFTVLRDGSVLHQFPYLTIAGSPESPGTYRIYDFDLGRVRYEAAPGGKDLFLTEACCDRLTHHYVRR